MNFTFVLFWGGLILASVAWYAFLVFYVGIKAGREIRDMMRRLQRPRKE
jgi:hypothetical protein